MPTSAIQPSNGHLSHLLNDRSRPYLEKVASRESYGISRQHSLENEHKEMYSKGRLKTISSLLDVEVERKERKEYGNIKLRKHR